MVTRKQYQTPGVYIAEQDAFSSSIVEVPTAVPVFIAYTEMASDGSRDLTNVAVAVSSLAKFMQFYGGAPQLQFSYAKSPAATPPLATAPGSQFFRLFYSLMLFFNNGGGRCYIVSIGSYANGVSQKDHMRAFETLAREPEPTIVVMPDAVQLPWEDWLAVSQEALRHCAATQSRVAILDVWNGFLPADGSAADPIQGRSDGGSGFYPVGTLGEVCNQYGAAYYPWLNTTVISRDTIDYTWLSAASLPDLRALMRTEAATLFAGEKLQQYLSQCVDAMVLPLATSPDDPDGTRTAATVHRMALAASPLYQRAMSDIAASANLMPPSGAMAGVYVRNDATFGVSKAPANTGIICAVSPAVALSDQDQAALNMPLNGMAVNAIRTFPTAGLLVWGARTLAGNSDDWRYISIRRTAIMLEQSIKAALQAYLFAPNDNMTWTAINSSVSSFLTSQWQSGALVGSKPEDAFSVRIGLGSTMTGEDIALGYLRLQVQVALLRPAEFLVLTFEQQTQTSP